MPRNPESPGSALEIRSLGPEHEQALSDFFDALKEEGVDAFFHPHALTDEEARRRCLYAGKDLYYVLVEEGRVLGYGMLRGWDEGFDIPSVGLATRSSARGAGLSTLLVNFLHAAARRRGARKAILKVYKENSAAKKLFEDIGYTFSDTGTRQLSGSIDL